MHRVFFKLKYLINRVCLLVLSCLIMVSEKLIKKYGHDGDSRFLNEGQFEWSSLIESNSDEIVKELNMALVDSDDIPAFHEISEAQKPISKNNDWKTLLFYVFGNEITVNCKKYPSTASSLRMIPGLQNGMFSILAPRTEIPLHRGPYKGLVRYHLALKIPVKGDCYIEVGGERRSWVKNKSLFIDDSFVHGVVNNTDETRVVLFADFVRPLPLPLSWLNYIVIYLISLTDLAREPIDKLQGRGQGG